MFDKWHPDPFPKPVLPDAPDYYDEDDNDEDYQLIQPMHLLSF